jgi:hypothetical protein
MLNDAAPLSSEELHELARFMRKDERRSRRAADLLGTIAGALTNSHALGHGARDQVEKWVRDVIRDELSKRMETNVSN